MGAQVTSAYSYQPQAMQVADLIAAQKRLLGFLIYAVSLMRDERFVSVPFPDARSSIGFSRKTSGGRPADNLYPSLSEIRQDPEYVTQALRAQLMAMISFIGDALALNQYFDHAAIIEFVRHIRNGISHGNRFTFRHGEPTRIATFQELTISVQENSNEVLFGFILTGDVVSLITDLEDYLRQLA